jgi:hypothetical protein
MTTSKFGPAQARLDSQSKESMIDCPPIPIDYRGVAHCPRLERIEVIPDTLTAILSAR